MHGPAGSLYGAVITAIRGLQRMLVYVLAIAHLAALWLVIRPLRGIQSLASRLLRKMWGLFLAPFALVLSVAMLFGFLLGFVLSQVAVYLEVFPKRRGLAARSASPQRLLRERSGNWDAKWPRESELRFERPPAESAPPSLQTSAHETEEDDEYGWKEGSILPTSEDDSDFLGPTEGEDAAAEQSTIASGSTIASPKYLGPVGIGFYAQFRPDNSEIVNAMQDDAADDGYTSPARSRSEGSIRRTMVTSSPLSSPLITPPLGSPLVCRSLSLSREHSLTQIHQPIYEEDET